jgi:hypothetical protein
MRDLLRFWVEAGLGVASAALLLVTLLWPDWLELVLHIDPDGGNGAVEWVIVAGFALAAVVFLVVARADWQRARRLAQAERSSPSITT